MASLLRKIWMPAGGSSSSSDCTANDESKRQQQQQHQQLLLPQQVSSSQQPVSPQLQPQSPLLHPSRPPSPDLNHLTLDERQKLMEVIERQQSFDKVESERLGRLRDDIVEMEQTVRRHESTRRHEADLALCRLCFSSKFADGIGRMCSECKRRVCSSCGSMNRSPDDGKNAPEKWRCKLCQKRRELVCSTGVWFHGEFSSGLAVDSKFIAPPATVSGQSRDVDDQSDAVTASHSSDSSRHHQQKQQQPHQQYQQPQHQHRSTCMVEVASQSRDPRDTRDTRDSRDTRDTRDSRDTRDTRDSRDSRDTRDTRDTRDSRDSRDSRDTRDTRDSRDPKDTRDTRDSRPPPKNSRKQPRRSSETTTSSGGQGAGSLKGAVGGAEEDETDVNSDQFMRERQRLRHQRIAAQRKMPRRKPPRRASVGTSTQEDNILPTGPECPVHGISFDMMPLARLLSDSKHFHSEPEFGGRRGSGSGDGDGARRYSLQSTRSMPAVGAGGRRRTLATMGGPGDHSDHHLSSTTLSVKQISGSATSSDNDPNTAIASGSTTITPISGEGSSTVVDRSGRQRLSSLPTTPLGCGGSNRSPTSSTGGLMQTSAGSSTGAVGGATGGAAGGAGCSTSPRPKRPRGRAASSTAFMFTMRSSSRESADDSDMDKLSTRAHDGKRVAHHESRRRQSDTPLYHRARHSHDSCIPLVAGASGGYGATGSFADFSRRWTNSTGVAARADVTARHGRGEPLEQIPSEERPSDAEMGRSSVSEDATAAAAAAGQTRSRRVSTTYIQVVLERDCKELSRKTNGLGFRVVGGKKGPDGRLGAIVTDVTKDGPADLNGLRIGDHVIEWDGYSLLDASAEQVKSIIDRSGQNVHLVLLRQRALTGGKRMSSASSVASSSVASSFYSASTSSKQPVNFGSSFPDQVTEESEKSSSSHRSSGHTETGETTDDVVRVRDERSVTPGRCGQLCLRLLLNSRAKTLTVCAVEAKELPVRRSSGRSTSNPHPYLKVCLLPNRRGPLFRSRVVTSSRNPEWIEYYIFNDVLQSALSTRALEVTVWDSMDDGQMDTFMGEVLLELDKADLHNASVWYLLSHHEETSGPLPPPSPKATPRVRRHATSSTPSSESTPSLPVKSRVRGYIKRQDSLVRSRQLNKYPSLNFKDDASVTSSSSYLAVTPSTSRKSSSAMVVGQTSLASTTSSSEETRTSGGLNLPSTSAAALGAVDMTGLSVADKGERRFSVVKRRMSEAMAKVSRKLLERRARSLESSEKAQHDCRVLSKAASHADSTRSASSYRSSSTSIRSTSSADRRVSMCSQLQTIPSVDQSPADTDPSVHGTQSDTDYDHESRALRSVRHASTSSQAANGDSRHRLTSNGDDVTALQLGPGQVAPKSATEKMVRANIKLGFLVTRGQLEVDVICVKGMTLTAGDQPPDTYVKTYLLGANSRVQKRKSKTIRAAYDPAFKQKLKYSSHTAGDRSLQVLLMVKGNGFEKSACFGAVTIKIDKLDLSRHSVNWYRLFTKTAVDSGSTDSL